MVTVMLCFARSGGTVLNQCLGSLPDVVIMSEVNPLGGGWGKEEEKSLTTVKAQAKGWYNIDIESEDFADAVVELSEKCKHLIIRDWSFVNFFPNMGMNLPDGEIVFTPPNHFLTLKELKGRCKVKPFAFVRDAIDVYLSRGGNLYQFGEVYLRYVQEIIRLGIPICKYETFCLDPAQIIKDICDYTGLPYVDVHLDYTKFTTVNGEVQHASRGQTQGKIAPLPRIEVSQHIVDSINACADLRKANELLTYPIEY